MEIAAAQQVHVQVRHRLPAAILAIDNETIAVVQLELLGKLSRHDGFPDFSVQQYLPERPRHKLDMVVYSQGYIHLQCWSPAIGLFYG